MKKLLTLALVALMAFSAVACAPAATDAPAGETVTVTVTDAAANPIDVAFPVNAEKVVVLNWQTMDFLDAVGMGDKVVGLIKSGRVPDHLAKYVEDESIANVGGMKEPDMEAIMSLQPDIIFTSDRIEDQYDAFAAIAPTMCAYVDYEAGFMESYKALAVKHGQIFGVSGEVDEIIAGYEARIADIAAFAEGKTALLGIFAGGLNTLGNTGRCSIIVNEMGFTNLAGDENVNHGNLSTYETFLQLNPEYMFILDKDNAVGEEATAAKEQMEVDNLVIAQTSAFQEGKIIYLEPDTAWYVADGGITSMNPMIANIEEGIGLK